MIDKMDNELKLVEYNLHSIGGVPSKVSQWYRFLFKTLKKNFPIENEATQVEKFASFIGRAVDEYEKMYETTNTLVVIVSLNNDLNMVDKRYVEIALRQLGYQTKLIDMADFCQKAKMDENNRRLLIQEIEVSVVYYRICPDEDFFSSDILFHSLIQPIEMSRSVKIPDIGQVLVNFKKVQQFLSSRKCGYFLKTLVYDDQKWQGIEKTFVETYDLHDSSIAKMALNHIDNFVLKLAFHEGGGTCLFNEDAKVKIEKWLCDWEGSLEERRQFVLMKKILPPSFENWEILPGYHYNKSKFTAEFGFFGGLLAVDGQIIANDNIGYNARCKDQSANESGIRDGNGRTSYLVVKAID